MVLSDVRKKFARENCSLNDIYGGCYGVVLMY